LFYPLTKATADLLTPIALHEAERAFIGLDKDGSRYLVNFCKQFAGHFTPGHYEPRVVEDGFIARVPERRQDPARKNFWTFGGTDITTALFVQAWPQSQIEWSASAASLRDYWIATRAIQHRNAQIYAEWTAHKTVPPHDLELHPNEDLKLSPFQLVAATCALQSEGFAYFMEPGCGKTPTSVVTFCNVAKRIQETEKRPTRCIVVVPKNARFNWQKEIAKFATRNTNVAVLRGDPIQRRRQVLDLLCEFRRECLVVVCSYDALWRSWDTLGAVDWDIAALDESHFIKSISTARCEYAFYLRDKAKKRLILTGTEITNSMLDLWSQLEFLGKGYSGFMGHKNFKDFYGVFAPDQDGHDMLVGSKNTAFIQERLAGCSFKITTEEACPYLPKRVYKVTEIELTDAQKEIYYKLKKELAVEIAADLANGDLPRQMVVRNSFTKLLRLAEITSGIVRWDATLDLQGNVTTPKWVEYFDENPKLEQLIQDIRALKSNHKMIAWCCFTPNIWQISARLEKERIPFVQYYGDTNDRDRQAAEHRFNNDDSLQVLVGNPAAGGIALNLWGHPEGKGPHKTHGVTEKFFSQGWPPTVRWQAECRMWRRGTEWPVEMDDYCVLGSIDEQIRMSAVEKKINASMISDLSDVLNAVINGNLE